MSLYTMFKSAVSRPVEINFSIGEDVRFKPYETLYVAEDRLSADQIATEQVAEHLNDGVLRCIGIHLTPIEIMSVEEVIDEIVNARSSSTRGVRFLSIDDRMEAMENDLLDVVTVSDLPVDGFNVPSDTMYNNIMDEITEARKNQQGNYSYTDLKSRLDALCDAIDAVDYRNIDINSLIERISALEEIVNSNT